MVRDAPLVLAVGPDGRIAAVCRAVAGALHPHKVLAERPAESGRPVRRRRRDGGAGGGARLSMHVARGLDHLPRSEEPVFVVVGVFDGLHLGHAYLLEHLVAEAARRSARPVVITFDHHPDEILTGSAPPLLCDPDERLERLAAAGVDTTVVVHFDQRLRETTYDAFVAMIAGRAPACRVPDDARCRVRLPAGRDPGDARGARARSTGSRWSWCRRSSSTGARSAARRSARRSRPGTSRRPRTCWDAPTASSARPSSRATGQGSLLRFPLPVALPPDGTYRVEVGPVHAGASDEAVIDAGSVRLLGTPAAALGPRRLRRRAPDRAGVSRRRSVAA